MGLHKDNDYRDDHHVNDADREEDPETRHHRKRIRQMLEDRLERKRLRDELDDFESMFEDEFDWEQHRDKEE